MPIVNGKHFPYDKKGMMKASEARKKAIKKALKKKK